MSRAERKLEEESGRMMGMFQLNKGRGKGSAFCNFQRREKAAVELETQRWKRGPGAENRMEDKAPSCCEEISPDSQVPTGRTPVGRKRGGSFSSHLYGFTEGRPISTWMWFELL